MFARLRSAQDLPTPVRSDSPQAFRKRRLFVSEDEDDATRPSTPKIKRHTYYSVAPIFEKHKRPRIDEDDNPQRRFYSYRRRPSPSPDPEPPLITETAERYAYLSATLHSAAIAGLEEAGAKLTATAEADIRANRQNLATLEAQGNKLVGPLQDLTVDYRATNKNGREHAVAVAISEAAAAFERKLENTNAELDILWAS